MLLLLPYTEYLGRLAEPRNIADIVLVFLLVYAVLKLVRGTRAAPMAAGIAAFAILYWLALKENLATLEFVLRGALLYIGVAIIVLFQSEIRQALISFGNRFRMPFTRRHHGQFGEGVYDEIVLAATTLSSTKTGALIVIERNVGLKNVTDGGVKLDAELSYDLLVSIFNPATPLHDGAVVVRRHRICVVFPAPDFESAPLEGPGHATSGGHRRHGRHRRGGGSCFRRDGLDLFRSGRPDQTRPRRNQTSRGYFPGARGLAKERKGPGEDY